MASSMVVTNYEPKSPQTSTLRSVSSGNQINTRAPLPSVLAPRPLPSMPYPTATSHLIAILSQQQNQCLPLLPRPVTIVHYDVTGAPIISPHLLGIDEFTLTSEHTLQLLVLHIQSVLDTKMGVMEGEYEGNIGLKYEEAVGDVGMQDTTGRKGKLLVSSIEVRGGGERFFKEFPGIMGGVVWSKEWKSGSNESGLANGRYDGREAECVMWNHDGGELQMYWEYYRMVVMKGIMLQVEKPILKVRTVRRVVAEGVGLAAGGHIFRRIISSHGEKCPDLIKDTKEDEGIGQIKKSPCSNVADLSSLNAPEFQVTMLFQEQLKSNDNPDLESIYNDFLQQGGQPMKELVLKSKNGHNRGAAWVRPDGLDYPDGSDVDTIRANEESRELVDADPILPSPVTIERRLKFVEAEEAAIGFDEKDDNLFFLANSKPPTTRSARKTQQRRRQNTLINRFRNRVQGTLQSKPEAGSLHNHNIITPRIPNSCPSPGANYPSLAASPTPSMASQNLTASNVQLASPAQILQPGSTAEARRSCPLQWVATTSQLRPESPAFNFPLASKIPDSKPANWNFGLLGLFNSNETAKATGVGKGPDTGYQASQTNMSLIAAVSTNTGVEPHIDFQSSQIDQGMAFDISMTRTPPVGPEQSTNFQTSYPEQNVVRAASMDSRASPYLLYPNSQQSQVMGFNPSLMHNPFAFSNNLYSGHLDATLNTATGGNTGVDMNLGMGGHTSDFSDPSNSIFTGNLNAVNGFGGTM